MFTVNRHPSIRELHKYGVGMLIGFGAIGTLLWLWNWIGFRPFPGSWNAAEAAWTGSTRQIAAVCFWVLGTGMSLLSYVAPRSAKHVYVAWMSVVVPIGIVMSTVMLSILYFVLLPVFSLIVRFGDPLGRKSKSGGTYWEDHKLHEPTLERMGRQF